MKTMTISLPLCVLVALPIMAFAQSNDAGYCQASRD